MSSKAGSYAAVAAKINEISKPAVPVTRQQVYSWHRNRTRNAAGAEFPQPAYTMPWTGRGGKHPRVYFSFLDVLSWYAAGPSKVSGAARDREARHRVAA